MASFFYYGRLSSAQLDCWQAPPQWPIIDQHQVEQTAYRREIKDYGYKSVFTNSWLVRQRNRSWIKGLGKNPQKSEVVHREPTDSEKRLRVYKSSATMARHAWHVDKAPAKTHKNRNARLGALRSAVPTKIACLYGLRCELVKVGEDHTGNSADRSGLHGVILKY